MVSVKQKYMQFNDTSTKTGICQEIDDICNSDSNSYPLPSKARRVNAALERFFILARKAARPGTVADTNLTTAPVQSITLTSGTQSYALDTFTAEMLSFLRLEVTDSNGDKHLLRRLDRENVKEALDEYKSENGTPKEYDILGEFIYLYPTPDFTLASALTAYYDAAKSAFVSGDTTKSPGIPSDFHTYIARYASMPYLVEFQKEQKNDIAALIAQDEREIELRYLTRDKGARRALIPDRQDNR